MKEITEKPVFNQLLDMLPVLGETVKNPVLLGGTGGGWPARLAFNPSSKFSLPASRVAEQKLIDFININNGKLIVGFLSYDFGMQLQGVKSIKNNELDLPDIYFLAYDNYLEEKDGQIKTVGTAIPLKKKPVPANIALKENFKPTDSRAGYEKLFNKILSYIKAGHIYQINLAHLLKARSDADPRKLFSLMADKNQASMMGYLEGEGFELLSVSPERFIKIKNKIVTTTPIKGTRARTKDEINDTRQLYLDSKEKSELDMITDLLRNDLAKISEPGSVKIKSHRSLQALTSVIHTFSTVAGKLKENILPIEALLSMFPGGSVTGCPKKRAMEIIEELEPFKRNIYCGSLVCIGPDGELDSSILIRTVIKKGQELTLPVGGGIVFDSKENSEYKETLQKAKSIIGSFRN